MLLSIENLTFGWQKELLFERVSGHVHKNDIIQLIGDNGVGKTTLFQLIAGMIPHFNRGEILQGDIFINNRSIIKESPKHFFPTIALIPGDNPDFFIFTETLNQEILLIRSVLNIDFTLTQKRLGEFSQFFPDINAILNEPFKTMQFYQKIIALTFIFYLQNASLFLFDEVLNTFSEPAIQSWYSFFNYVSSNGRAIIFADHHGSVNDYSQWLLKNKKLIKIC